MPVKPRRWCARCKEPHSGDCPHVKPFERKRQGKRSGRGGRPWRRKREQIFARDRYLCQEHLRLGQVIGVTLHGPNAGVLDHIKPLSEGGEWWADDNLQTLCQACSQAKTQRESQGRGRV